jgi:hypothetical protein
MLFSVQYLLSWFYLEEGFEDCTLLLSSGIKPTLLSILDRARSYLRTPEPTESE